MKNFKRNVLLKNHTSFRIGGPARFFFTAKTKNDLIKAIAVAQDNKIPFFILGGGSNLLVSDRGYNGLVIKIQNTLDAKRTPRRVAYKIQDTRLFAEAGVNLGDLVKLSSGKFLTGLEWAVGIPGTVGGAARGNAGAFGKSISDVVRKVEVYDFKKEKIKTIKNKDCKFKYRDSIFKQNKNLIILSTEIQLEKGKKKDIQKKMKEYLNYRKDYQPLNFPSAGSIFKNPERFSAGELIEKCGLKGKKINDAQISQKHANFIVNLGGAKAKDIVKLIQLAKKKVKEKFGVELKEEIQYLGF